MSGHSKWSTIKRQKGMEDAKRSNTFTKIANMITVSAKQGGSGDPNSNPRLRFALDQAKTVNMPKDNIQRAIDRGMGNLPGQILEEVVYEGFGPSRVAVIVEGITDNKNRTLQGVRNVFERSGGTFGAVGSTSYMFDKKGEVKAVSKGGELDDELLELIDLGAGEIEDFEEDGLRKYLIYIEPTSLTKVSTNITQSGYTVESSGVVYKPNILVTISSQEEAEKIFNFIEKLEENDDVQAVFANFDIPEDLLN